MMQDKRPLYRNQQKGKIAGVCAGIADYFHSEVWLVRVAIVSAFLLGGSGLILVAYIAMWLILDVAPPPVKSDYQDIQIKQKVWQTGESPKKALADVAERFNQLESRLQSLEHYVTSSSFNLKRQFKNL